MIIEKSVWDQILLHLTDEYPREGVGVLVRSEIQTLSQHLRYIPLCNTANDEAHFQIGPQEWSAMLHALENSKEQLAAIVHSHPNTVHEPSEEDVEQFYYPNALMLIVAIHEKAEPTAGLYKKIEQRMERCQLVIEYY